MKLAMKGSPALSREQGLAREAKKKAQAEASGAVAQAGCCGPAALGAAAASGPSGVQRLQVAAQLEVMKMVRKLRGRGCRGGFCVWACAAGQAAPCNYPVL